MPTRSSGRWAGERASVDSGAAEYAMDTGRGITPGPFVLAGSETIFSIMAVKNGGKTNRPAPMKRVGRAKN
jgi:hypothetical protein